MFMPIGALGLLGRHFVYIYRAIGKSVTTAAPGIMHETVLLKEYGYTSDRSYG